MKDKTEIRGKATPIYDIGTGHRERPGRAGIHQHRATKRNRTRADQHRNAIKDNQ